MVLPARAAGRPVPLYIQALARHRHYNIDIIFTTQKHDQIDNFVRGLINQHIHVKNKFGLKGAVLKTWDEFQLNTKSKPDSSPFWKYPVKNYGLYKSATEHSIKRKIPWYLWAPLPLLALIGGLVWYVVHNFGGQAASAPVAASAANGAGVVSSRDSADDELRQRDYAKWLAPRVAGQPWTAPAWDQLQPQGVPDLYCIAVDDGRCECRTEQGTAYHVQPGICRTIAREGVYNPFRKPINAERNSRREDRPSRARDSEPHAETPSVASANSGYWPKSSMPQHYDPPQHTIVTRGDM
jgi:hypothetical protein